MSPSCEKTCVVRLVPIYFQNLDDYPLDNEQMQRQIQLDNEAFQRLIMSQMAQQISSSAQANQNPERAVNMSSGAMSPLGQAMLQIHSPSTSASGNEATEADVEDNGANIPSDRVNRVNEKSPNKDSDEVFVEKQSSSPKTDLPRSSLHSAISHLIASQATVGNREEIAKNIGEALNLHAVNAKLTASENGTNVLDVNKMKESIMNGGQKLQKTVSPTGLKSPSRASSEIIIPRPPSIQNNTGGSSGSPRSGGTGTQERRKIKKEPKEPSKPHPAFNVPPSSFDKLNGFYYNYSLPDRGLGTSISPVPVSVSPPAVRHQRSPPVTHRSPPLTHPRLTTASPVMPAQVASVVGLMPPGWPVRGHSPSGDSRSSGSPLDLSGPKESVAKIIQEVVPPELSLKHKAGNPPIRPARMPVPPVHSPIQVPRMALPVPSTQLQMPKSQPVCVTAPVQIPSYRPSESIPQYTATVHKEPVQKKQVSPPVPNKVSPPVPNKVPYVKETLYVFGDKEVEIISVGKNKWIVRNETDLCNIVNKHISCDMVNGGADEHLHKNENCSNCGTGSEERRDSLENVTTETGKRQTDTYDNSPQRAKVTKHMNGDIHSEENSPEREQLNVPQTSSLLVTTAENTHSMAAILTMDAQSGAAAEGKTCPVLTNILNVKPVE